MLTEFVATKEFFIPTEWKVLKLAATSQPGQLSFVDGDWIESPYITNHGIRLVQTGNIGLGQFLDRPDFHKFISEESFRELGCKWVYPGDILICRLADPIGRACIVPPEVGPCVTSVDCTIYRPNPEIIDSAFAIHLFNLDLQLQKLADLAGGTTRQRISRSNLGNIDLLLPPLPQQHRIAEILDTADAAIRQTEAQIAKLKQIKTGLLHDLLTRGLDAQGCLRDPVAQPEEFKDSPLGRVPRGWEIWPLENKVERIIDYRGKTPEKTERGIPLITAKNVRDGYLDPEPQEYINASTYDAWMTRGIPREGDVLFTTEAPLGNVARVPGYKLAVGQRIITLCSDPGILDAGYLFWLLLWQASRRRIEQKSTGSTVVGIKASVFRKIPFQFPPIQEQRKIAATLDTHDARIRAKEARLAKLRQVKQGLMDDLLTGRVRVGEHDTDLATDARIG